MGPSLPRDQLTIQSGFDLMRRKVRINSLVDNKGGGVILNQYNFLCVQTATCPPSPPDAPTWDQARSVAANNGTVYNAQGQIATTGTKYATNFGYYENGQFWRLREVSATFNFPDAFAQKIARAQNASITLGATQPPRVDEVHG